jgi:hypothetical protein
MLTIHIIPALVAMADYELGRVLCITSFLSEFSYAHSDDGYRIGFLKLLFLRTVGGVCNYECALARRFWRHT